MRSDDEMEPHGDLGALALQTRLSKLLSESTSVFRAFCLLWNQTGTE